MTPYPYQRDIAQIALLTIKKYGIVYLAMEERTGKTYTSILTVEASKAKRCLVVTKKKALMGEDDIEYATAKEGWAGTFNAMGAVFDGNKTWCTDESIFTLANYHDLYSQHKEQKKIKGKWETVTVQTLKPEYNAKFFDVIILDEPHAYLSAYPKVGAIAKIVQQISYDKPIIYLSATPFAQGYQLLFHQLNMSKYSPFDSFKNFYRWFDRYGIPEIVYTGHGQKIKYDTVKNEVWDKVNHLFITKTRAELGFEFEPEDIIHWVELDETTKDVYNSCQEDEMFIFNDIETPLDSSMKLRTTLHMIEGGVFKHDDKYGQLQNKEKIDAIKRDFGDRSDTVIMYHYKAEGIKLREHFRHAKLLQGTSYAEGVDLSDYSHLIIFSQDFSTSKHSQRRARQANRKRDTAISVHFYLVKGAISEQVYDTVSLNKTNFIDKLFKRNRL